MRKQLLTADGITSTRLTRRQFLAATAAGAAGVAIIANRLGATMDSNLTLLDRATFGAYAAKEPWPNVQPHYELEKALGMRLPIMSWFQSWTNGWLAKQSADAAASGHDLQIALAPAYDNGTGVPFTEILAGKWNSRLDRYFQGAANFPGKVSIRLAHEMNLGQHPWSIANPNGCTNDLDVWLDTWRYVVDRQRAVGGNNVTWQWCVDSIDMGGVRAESYWPGADYVDILSIDAYNGYGPWTPAQKIIQPMYDRITALHPTAPVWLGEVGCRNVIPGEKYSKAQWYQDLFAMTAMPRIAAVLSFNQNKERDWRLTGDDVLPVVSDALRQQSQQTR